MILDSGQSRDAVAFAWVLVDSDKSFLEVESNRKVVFASGSPGRYTFALIAANVADGKPQVAIDKHVLTIGNPGPGPGPGPNPPVPPGPNPDPLPPGKYGLASFVRDAAVAVQLDPATKRSTAAALANSYESVASMIAAGAISKAEDIINATKANNITAVGTHRDAWRPWATSLQAKCNALSEGKTLVTADDHAIAWREIAAGLRAVQ